MWMTMFVSISPTVVVSVIAGIAFLILAREIGPPSRRISPDDRQQIAFRALYVLIGCALFVGWYIYTHQTWSIEFKI